VDRGKPGSKHGLLVDGAGRVPVAVRLDAANRPDVEQLLPLLDDVPPVRGAVGRPRRRFGIVQTDRGFDSEENREGVRARRSEPLIAKRRTPHGSGLGQYRWVVERAESWLHKYRRLKFRYEVRDDVHEAFLALACALICLNCLSDPFC
jgi:transposase